MYLYVLENNDGTINISHAEEDRGVDLTPWNAFGVKPEVVKVSVVELSRPDLTSFIDVYLGMMKLGGEPADWFLTDVIETAFKAGRDFERSRNQS